LGLEITHILTAICIHTPATYRDDGYEKASFTSCSHVVFSILFAELSEDIPYDRPNMIPATFLVPENTSPTVRTIIQKCRDNVPVLCEKGSMLVLGSVDVPWLNQCMDDHWLADGFKDPCYNPGGCYNIREGGILVLAANDLFCDIRPNDKVFVSKLGCLSNLDNALHSSMPMHKDVLEVTWRDITLPGRNLLYASHTLDTAGVSSASDNFLCVFGPPAIVGRP
jgi:hypothetical protein